MATITALSLTRIRHFLASGQAAVGTKPEINAAAQAIENLLEQTSTQTAIGSTIETAAPGVFNAAAKRRLFIAVVLRKGLEEF